MRNLNIALGLMLVLIIGVAIINYNNNNGITGFVVADANVGEEKTTTLSYPPIVTNDIYEYTFYGKKNIKAHNHLTVVAEYHREDGQIIIAQVSKYNSENEALDALAGFANDWFDNGKNPMVKMEDGIRYLELTGRDGKMYSRALWQSTNHIIVIDLIDNIRYESDFIDIYRQLYQ